jgi:hypothetical protein
VVFDWLSFDNQLGLKENVPSENNQAARAKQVEQERF